jgi:lysophospholipase L1-like esterase
MRLARVARGLAVSLIVLCAIEGASSLFLFGWDLAVNAEAPLAERKHTVYDAELGWVNAPKVAAPNLYGPGRSFTSDSRGFRGAREVTDAVPPGKTRIVCSGDSFTLGYGVDDAQSWPAQLEALDAALECVNMGQGGYGLDQAYLWFARDAKSLQHDLHLFAFIADDFERMRSASFLGYGKPRLAASSDGVSVGFVPVPRASLEHPWWTQNAKRFFDLRTLSLARRALGTGDARAAAPGYMDEVEAESVATHLLAALAGLDAQKHSRLALVYLPNKDHAAPGRLTRLSGWMQRAVDAARASGTAWIDLTDDFEQMSESQRETLFIPHGEIELPGAAGHYSAAGNRFVAERVLAHVRELGLLQAKR